MKQAFFKFGLASKFALAGAFLFGANYGWAAFTACTTASTLGSFGVPGAPGDGCKASDQTFGNFEIGADGNPLLALSATTTGYDLIAATAASLAPVATYTNNVAANGVGAWNDLSHNGSQQLFQQVNAVNEGAPTPPVGFSPFLLSISLTGTATFSGNQGDELTVAQDLCLGTVAAGSCTAATAGIIITETFGGTSVNGGNPTWTCVAAAGSGSLGVCLSTTGGTVELGSVTHLTIDTTIASAENSPSLTDFVDSYVEGDTPEPSTFVLLGSALGGLGALRLRKRKQA